jgi:RNA polymerase sigma factor (TIGR02999 family)
MSEVTRILLAIEGGDPTAAEQLLPLVYDELRKLAAVRMAGEAPGQTLQPTALVHEAYVRLVGTDQGHHWNSRGHFFAAAAEAMRRILVDRARRKKAEKHGGGRARLDLDQVEALADAHPEDVLALDESIDQLTRHDPVCGQLVQLLCFSGLSVEQAAEALGLSRATAYRQWTFARAWLRSQITGAEDAAAP